ncbi:4Fe-4S binding protein [Candidatus Bipolaricaulota bacterium]|nr:4Fe-4S binding protein [Candidatus Bipolaricaulota bacterium]
MVRREIINIDEGKCTGCGDCIPSCPEGALQLINGKARLVNETFCDGLRACLNDCPEGAITIEEREAQPYNEEAVAKKMLQKGDDVLEAHLEHLKEHGQSELLIEALDYLGDRETNLSLRKFENESPEGRDGGKVCPGVNSKELETEKGGETPDSGPFSRLEQWPVQLTLLPPEASYLEGAELLFVADCVPFAYGNFHNDFLEGNKVAVGCPKLDDANFYTEKLTDILKNNEVSKIKTVHMEVPCCFGMNKIVEEATKRAGKEIPTEETTVTVEGEIKT